MKSFFTQLVLIAGLSVLAVSCGGSKGGSKGSSAVGVNPLAYNLNGTSAQALANVTAWYNSTSEGSFGTPGLGQFFSQQERKVTVYSANGGCTTKPIKFLGLNLGNGTLCNSSDSIQSQNFPVSPINPTANGASKASAVKVTSILNGSLGSISNVTTAQNGSGIVYILTVTPNVNVPNITNTYVIDPGVNSALNPVYSMDSATRTEESLIRLLN